MAIDGTKIIDSDLAHDIYTEFMDLYDDDIDIVEIKQKIEKWRGENLDEVEYEIFITSYALALWETGNLTDNILRETQLIIDKGAGSNMWLEESGETDSKSRQKELENLLKKISTPKNNPRKRKRYKKITNFLFQIDDVIIFQIPDRSYRAAILVDIFHYKGNCVYQFTPTSYMSQEKPLTSAIKDSYVFINKIGCLYDRETVKKMQPGIEKFWALDDKFSIPFTIGLVIYGIEHKDLINFKEMFEVISKEKIKSCFKELGSIGYENTFESFAKRFENIIDNEIKIFKREMVKLRDLEGNY